MFDHALSPSRRGLALILACALLGGMIALPTGPMVQGMAVRTFYVSPAGSDQGAGTREDPWADPGFASQQLQPGDTLILLPGTYHLQGETARIAPAVSGTPGAWITVQGEEGSRPLLLGSGGLPVAIDLRGRSYIRLAHLEISSALDDPYTGGLLEGIEAGTAEAGGEAVSHLELEDLAIHHVEAVGIHLAGSAQNLTLRDITVSYTGSVGILAFDEADGLGGERVTLERVTCSHIGAFAQGGEQRSGWEQPDCLSIGRSVGPVTILRSTFELGYGDGIDCQAGRTLIEGCTVANNAGDGIKLGSSESQVVNTLVFGTGYPTPGEETASSLLVIESEEEGGTFQVTNCTFFDDVQRADMAPAWRMQRQHSGVGLQVGLRNTIVAGLSRGSCDTNVELAVDHCLFWNRLDAEEVQVEFVDADGLPLRIVTPLELSGWGTSNLYGDPFFFLPSWGPDGDFHLQPDSPALAAGTPEGAPPVDLKSHSRENPPDIGAYQQSKGTPLPTESPSTTPAPLPFPDLAGHWAETTVRGLVAAGILNGYPDNTFRPDRPITRAEFCKAFATTFSIPPSLGESPFADIETHWARGEILALAGLQALRGYPDGTFQPDRPTTRAEIASILQRSFALLPLEQPASFSDLSPDFWAHAAVQAIVAVGLMRGYPDSTFRPLEQTTRAEAATVLARAQSLPPPSPTPSPTTSPTSPSPTPTLPGTPVAPPDQPVRLVFVHHSTGENWLADENGGLGAALRDSNYFTSDTNYGWGPEGIGDRTDIGNWWEWFRGPKSASTLAALFQESGQNCSYARMEGNPDPDGENKVILFKSCFPNSALQGSTDDPVPPIENNPLRGQGSSSPFHTLANAKGIYSDLLKCFAQHPEKLFVVVTAPPLSDSTYSANARALNQWLMNEWLKDYPYPNVAVLDFYNVLTSNGGNPSVNDLNWETGNHHRWWKGVVQHQVTGTGDIAAYPSSTGDDHPSRAGNRKATAELVPMLNVIYNNWMAAAP